jgi:hypothetical protein
MQIENSFVFRLMKNDKPERAVAASHAAGSRSEPRGEPFGADLVIECLVQRNELALPVISEIERLLKRKNKK